MSRVCMCGRLSMTPSMFRLWSNLPQRLLRCGIGVQWVWLAGKRSTGRERGKREGREGRDREGEIERGEREGGEREREGERGGEEGRQGP